MKNERKVVRVIFIAVVTFLLLPLTAFADEPFAVFDMNDRLAIEIFDPPAGGFGEVREIQEGSIEIAKVKVENLLPKHLYVLTVTVQPPGSFVPGNVFRIETSAPMTANKKGNLSIKKFSVGSLDPDTYRVDLFITHTHPPDVGVDLAGGLALLLNRDLLLACQPAPVVTVE